MNFILICLHCLDMRDFHSNLRNTPFLDTLRSRSVFIPMGRGQGHHCMDSLNAEITGVWTARYNNSTLTKEGFVKTSYPPATFPKTIIEYLREDGFDIFTCIGIDHTKCRVNEKYPGTNFDVVDPDYNLGTNAGEFFEEAWFKDQPERLKQFNLPGKMGRKEFLSCVKSSNKKFYAHIFLRDTHRPWGQAEGLCALEGMPPSRYPEDALCARKAALDKPDEFAALRRRGLERADAAVREIFEATKDIKDVAYLVYSNHGEVFDHFRYNLPYKPKDRWIVGTSHVATPYEVLYANMQMWVIPGQRPIVMEGIGRSIDIAPTVLELAGIKPEAMDGESMLPDFDRGAFPDRDRYAEVLGPAHCKCISMVRSDGYKFLSLQSALEDEKNEIHRLAVFHLKSDPYEYVNLIDTPRGREVFEWAIKKHRSLKHDEKISLSGRIARESRGLTRKVADSSALRKVAIPFYLPAFIYSILEKFARLIAGKKGK